MGIEFGSLKSQKLLLNNSLMELNIRIRVGKISLILGDQV